MQRIGIAPHGELYMTSLQDLKLPRFWIYTVLRFRRGVTFESREFTVIVVNFNVGTIFQYFYMSRESNSSIDIIAHDLIRRCSFFFII